MDAHIVILMQEQGSDVSLFGIVAFGTSYCVLVLEGAMQSPRSLGIRTKIESLNPVD